MAILSVLGIEKNEIKPAALAFSLLLLIWIGVNIGVIIIQSLLVKELGMQYFSLSFVAIAVFSILCYLIYLYVEKRTDIATHLFASSIISTILLISLRLIEYYLKREAINATIERIFFYTFLIFILSYSQTILYPLTWDIISLLFRPIKLKKLSTFFNLAPVVAGIFSSLLIKFTVKIATVQDLTILWGVILGLNSYLIYKFYLKSFSSIKSRFKPFQNNNKGSLKNLLESTSQLYKNRLSLIIIAITFFSSLATLINYYCLFKSANDRYTNEADLAIFSSNIQIIISTLILLSFLTFKHKILIKFGVFKNLLTVSYLLVFGFLYLILDSGFWELTTFRIGITIALSLSFQPAKTFACGMLDTNIRANARSASELSNKIANGLIGILSLVTQNIFYLNFIGFIFSFILWLYTKHGSTIYLNLIKSHLSKNMRLLETLDYLEDRQDPEIHDWLCKILLNENLKYQSIERLRAMETITRLENPDMLRPLCLILKDPLMEIRYAAVKSISILFRKVSTNPFIHHSIFEKMHDIIRHESNNNVRTLAIKFLFDNSGKKKFINTFFRYFKMDENPNTRLMALKTLNKLNLEFSDFAQINFLNDPNPEIRAEVASYLWRYFPYKSLANESFNNLLNSNEQQQILAAIKSISTIENNFVFKEQVKALTTNENIEIKIYAYLTLSNISKNTSERNEYVKELTLLMANEKFNSENKWKEFLGILMELKDDELIDEIIYPLYEKYNTTPEKVKGFKYLAELMYQKIELEDLIKE